MIIYIKPRSLFPQLHSDTIFGALIYAIDQLYPGNVEKLLEMFRDPETQPPFSVSSAFPFIENESKKVHFFPKPITQPVKSNSDNLKEFKKVEFLHEDIFRSWMSGSLNEGSLVEDIKSYTVENGFLMDNPMDVNFGMKNFTAPHNTINRITGASENIFYSSGTVFSNMGLFFMVKTAKKEYKKLFDASIKFLRDRGFGGNVSTGKGQFEYEISAKEFLTTEGDHLVTLSRYIPLKDELQAFQNDIWFELGSKRGRSADGSLKKQIRFFREGATFPSINKKRYGTIIDSNSQSVEYGIAYTAGML